MGRQSNNQTTETAPPAAPAGTPPDSTASQPSETPSDGTVLAASSDGLAGQASGTEASPPLSGDDAQGADDSANTPPPARRTTRDVVLGIVAKGRTVQDVDGKSCKAGDEIRVPTADHQRLLDLGFLAKPARQIVVPTKKGPSVTRGS